MKLLLLGMMVLLALEMVVAKLPVKKTKMPTTAMPTTAMPTWMPTTATPTTPTMAPTFNASQPAGNGSMFISYLVTRANFPAAMGFTPDGRIIYFETWTGKIIIYDQLMGTSQEVYTVPDVAGAGPYVQPNYCLGITFHYDYPAEPYLYGYCTVDGLHQVLKFLMDVETETVISTEVIFSAPAGYDDGGPLHFSPIDNKLYLSIGDGNSASTAQNMSNYDGKYIRMNDDGTVPSDNPFPNSPLTYVYGIRNSFEFAWDPIKGGMWSTDNGPACNDEINLLIAGGNYGWGAKAVCPNTNNNGKNVIKPKYNYKVARGTVGAAFDANGNFLHGSFDLDTIDLHVLNKKRNGIASTILGAYQHPEKGTMLEVVADPVSKDVYFSTISGIYILKSKLLGTTTGRQ